MDAKDWKDLNPASKMLIIAFSFSVCVVMVSGSVWFAASLLDSLR